MSYLSKRFKERSTAAGIGSAVSSLILLFAGGATVETAVPAILTGLAMVFLPTSMEAK